MRQINVRAQSDLIILNGPATLGIEHSLFDEQVGNEARKCVLFGYQHCEPRCEDYILKFDTLNTRAFTAIVLSATRSDSLAPVCTDWVLWVIDGGAKMILHYSTATRTGSGMRVSHFPEY